MPDPIHQFEIKRWIPLEFNGYDISFTNSSAFMIGALVFIPLFLMFAMRHRALVPSRLQSTAETAYEFIANMVHETMGKQGMTYFPFVFTIFILVFTFNMFGMIPGWFTVTSHLSITAALAAMVFITVLVLGFAKNGLHFLKLFVPQGVPIVILPVVVAIEIISFFTRPVSHSVRLFANMLAGHITLKVFGGFVVMLLAAGGAYTTITVLPLAMATALTALEFLVAFLQAYVFAMLTCMYLNDALHPGGH